VPVRWQHECWQGGIIAGVVQNGSGGKIKEKRGNNQSEVWLCEWWCGSNVAACGIDNFARGK